MGDALIVARLLAAGIVMIVLKDDLFLRRHQALPGAVLLPELVGCREDIEGQLRFELATRAGAIVKEKRVAVG